MLSTDPNRHFKVIKSDGFQIVERSQMGSTHKMKRCWEGNQLGSTIHISLPPCSVIAVTYYRKFDTSMARAALSIDDGETISVLDGWRPQAYWIAEGRVRHIIKYF